MWFFFTIDLDEGVDTVFFVSLTIGAEADTTSTFVLKPL
jgi:hypothetical protein